MQKIKVLLADHHETLRKTLVRFLEEQTGVESVTVAETGSDALVSAMENSPNVALIDVTMPGAHGFRITREFKQLFPSTRVFVLTLHEGGICKQIADENLADGVIEKSTMKKAIESIIAGEQAGLSTVNNLR